MFQGPLYIVRSRLVFLEDGPDDDDDADDEDDFSDMIAAS